MKRIAILLAPALLIAGAAFAASPYAGLEARDIKAMSPERVSDILAGKGAGYALAAELNGYPGPRHVLDLAADLELTPEQARETRAMFGEMEAQAKALGAELVAKEHGLEEAFRSGRIDEVTLAAQTGEIGKIDSRLRATHLKYHIRMAGILTPDQRAAYDRLRGYAARPGDGGAGHGGHGGGHGHGG